MDRLKRMLAGGTLALTLSAALASTGCRSTGNEIPPQPKYTTPGENPSAVGFNSSPHGYNGVGTVYGNNGMPSQPGLAGSAGGLGMGAPTDGLPSVSANGAGSSFGTPTPNAGNPALPTGNVYGGPGTSGLPGGAGVGAGAYGGGLGGAGLGTGGIGGR